MEAEGDEQTGRNENELMNLGADDYLVKPTPHTELLEAIEARFERQRLHDERLKQQLAKVSFQPHFNSAAPLVKNWDLRARGRNCQRWLLCCDPQADRH